MKIAKLQEQKYCLQLNKILFFVLLICSIMAIFLSGFVCKASLVSVGIYIFYLFVYIQLPGVCIANLFHLKWKSGAAQCMIAFFAGTALLFFEYFLFSMLDIYFLISYINPCISIIGLIWICTLNRCSCFAGFLAKAKSAFNYNFGIYICIIFLSSMLALQFSYIAPGHANNFVSVNQDIVWHMGNINSLSQGFPAMDPRVLGLPFEYHYFNELLQAICLKVFDLSADTLLISCGPYFITYVFGFSSYAFIYEYCKRKDKAGAYCIIILLSGMLLSFGNVNLDLVSLINFHIFTNTNAVAFGIGGVCVFLMVFKNMCETSGRKLLLKSAYAVILICVITGIKGPFGAVIVGAMVVSTLLESLIEMRFDSRRLIFTGLIFSGFLVTYLALISNSGGLNNSGISLSILETVSRSGFGRAMDWMTSYKPLSSILVFLMIIPQALYILAGFSIPFLYLLLKKGRQIILGQTDCKWLDLNLVTFVFIGFGGFFFINHYGFSQLYFVIPSTLVAACMVCKFYEEDYDSVKKTHRMLTIFFMICLTIGSGVFLFNTSMDIKNAVTNYKAVYSGQTQGEVYNSLTKFEYEGLMWLRKNSQINDVCISNRLMLYAPGTYDENDLLNNRYFYYSAYSQRCFFLEGFSYSAISNKEVKQKLSVCNSIYDSDNKAPEKMAKANGIKYIIVSRIIAKNLELENDNIDKCYNNQDITIYKVK